VANGEDRKDEPEYKDLDQESLDPTYHHNPFVRELRRLEKLDNYQKRGYEFQDFVGSLFKLRHFQVTSSPRTAKPRQTDLLATRGADSHIIETKWRSSKADINDIDSLFARLAAAPGAVVGLMVSHAGFTDSALDRVEPRSDRPVLLMTGSELARLVEWDDDLAHVCRRGSGDTVSGGRTAAARLGPAHHALHADRQPGRRPGQAAGRRRQH